MYNQFEKKLKLINTSKTCSIAFNINKYDYILYSKWIKFIQDSFE